MEGFTYNGIHSETLSVWFIPDAQDRWFASPEYEVYEDETYGSDGGYYYGNRAKIRKFVQKCFFEDITEETRERIRAWLDRNTGGQLVFDRRPFVHYDVRPSKVVDGKDYTHTAEGMPDDLISGTFTVTFSCYEPYGVLNYKYYEDFDSDRAGVYCCMLEKDEMPAAPTTASRSFLMYNCGTQPCNTVIRIGGTAANGLTIRNKTNGTYCKLSSLPASGILEIDSEIASVTHIADGVRSLDFSQHEEGFMKLDPPGWKMDDAVVTFTEGSTAATLDNMRADASLVGKYVLAGSAWKKITAADGVNGITLSSAAGSTDTAITKIVTMNEIEIIGNGVSLTTLEIDYTPVIA